MNLESPFAYFQWNDGWKAWEQVINEAAGEDGVVAAYLTTEPIVDEIVRLRAREARLREALERLIAACYRGRVVTKPGCGIGGMTLEANLRASNINGVSASAVEEARAALEEEKK